MFVNAMPSGDVSIVCKHRMVLVKKPSYLVRVYVIGHRYITETILKLYITHQTENKAFDCFDVLSDSYILIGYTNAIIILT